MFWCDFYGEFRVDGFIDYFIVLLCFGDGMINIFFIVICWWNGFLEVVLEGFWWLVGFLIVILECLVVFENIDIILRIYFGGVFGIWWSVG